MRALAQRQVVANIAELAGVHVSTVWRALTDDARISEATKQRVRRHARKFNYRPNMIARQLAMGRSLAIGLITSRITSEAQRKKIEALHDRIRDREYTLLLEIIDSNVASEKAAIEAMQAKQVEGLIILSQATAPENAHLHALSADGFPHILFDNERDLHALDSFTVALDRTEVANVAVRHLVELGHRRIAYLSPLSGRTGDSIKVKGFYRTMQAHNLAPTVFDRPHVDSRHEFGYRVIMENREALKPITGLVAHCDRVAMGALRACWELGLSVPDDISLIGFDNDEVGAVAIPPLTSIAHPFDEMARTAVDLLFERIEKPAQSAKRNVLINPKLVVRNSTGLVRSGKRGGNNAGRARTRQRDGSTEAFVASAL